MRYFKGILVVVCLISVFSCNSDDRKYENAVASELSRGVRRDSLFQGIKLGMTSKEFYTHCWEMNKKGIFFAGPGNTTVLYKLNKELKYPASMNFYPDFRQGKISKMRVSFSYDAFAPWNKQMFADSLQLDVLNMLKKWYKEKDFILITDPAKGTIFVQVDGNRRIIIGKYDDAHVKVDYTDLLTDEKK
ncbi:hypothetical protein [Mucilaginibacter gossypii]|uniref:Lipoprotein n=1 Tax=Mucilaginibacter gossypii TaxID=551996 RepID=A0A1G8P3J1_9SPHI|nr:hypothetical protein [Mucilaginibacter gossypii]SDI86400.1 hypothetical protein SAMN05192573_1412 [Mucilaginibacter gossypii]